MRNRVLLVLTVLGLVGCNGKDTLEVSALDKDKKEARLWAACVGTCTAYENCPDTSPDFICLIDTDTGAHATCTPQTRYCCQDLPCIHPPGDKYKYLYSPTPGPPDLCRTDWTCQPCPPGLVRNQSDPTNPACCSPSWSCASRCGIVADSCGWPQSCGPCPPGQTCLANGTCCTVLSQAQVCAGHCGVMSDGCGGSYNCGACGANQYCGSFNLCYCNPPLSDCGNPAGPCYSTCP